MSEIRFEWDIKKDKSNRRKHGVDFDEAATAFSDEHGLLLNDPDESHDQDRFVLMGVSSRLRLLVVVHCLRGEGDVIRIISARKGSASEGQFYHERLKR